MLRVRHWTARRSARRGRSAFARILALAGGGHYLRLPALNFVGWFVVSAAIFAVVPGGAPQSRPVELVGLSTILFFSIIRFAHSLHLAAGIGGLILGILARVGLEKRGDFELCFPALATRGMGRLRRSSGRLLSTWSEATTPVSRIETIRCIPMLRMHPSPAQP